MSTDHLTTEQLADQIETTPADETHPALDPDRQRPTSGMQRDTEDDPVDPAQYLGKADPTTPTASPATGRSRAPFVHSDAVSSIASRAREAARVGALPAFHLVAPTEPMRDAWQAVQDAWTAAEEALALIPVKMAEAEVERGRLAGQGDEPVALPSPQDVRAHYDAKALAACQQVVSARVDYDRVVVEEKEAHTASLEKSIPSLSSDVLERVRDLEQAVRDLRTGVASYVEVAGSSSPEVMPAKMPHQANLSDLSALEREAKELQAVAEQPSQPRITPTLAQREQIMQRSRAAVGGLTSEVVDLARRERLEEYRWTAHTRAVPESVLENAAAQAQR